MDKKFDSSQWELILSFCGDYLSIKRRYVSLCLYLPYGLSSCNFVSSCNHHFVALLCNLVPRVLSLLQESTLVAAGHVSARFLQIPEK